MCNADIVVKCDTVLKVGKLAEVRILVAVGRRELAQELRGELAAGVWRNEHQN